MYECDTLTLSCSYACGYTKNYTIFARVMSVYAHGIHVCLTWSSPVPRRIARVIGFLREHFTFG